MKVKEELKDYENIIDRLVEEDIFKAEYGKVIKQQLKWYIQKSNEGKRNYNMFNILIAITGVAIPGINIIQSPKIRIITTVLSIITGLMIYILKLKCYRNTWKNYRGAAERIKSLLRRMIVLDKKAKIKVKVAEVREEMVDMEEYFTREYENIVFEEVGLWDEWINKKHEVER